MEKDLHLVHFTFLDGGSGSDKHETSPKKHDMGGKLTHQSAFSQRFRGNVSVIQQGVKHSHAAEVPDRRAAQNPLLVPLATSGRPGRTKSRPNLTTEKRLQPSKNSRKAIECPTLIFVVRSRRRSLTRQNPSMCRDFPDGETSTSS